MNLFAKIRVWLGQLVQRPSDLFDIACGAASLYFVGTVCWNHFFTDEAMENVPSMSFLLDVAPLNVWLTVMGLAALGQPLALYFDNPNDFRHPIVQPMKWVRNLLACVLGSWFAILYISSWAASGPNHIQPLYALVLGMDAYIIAHVLFRPRLVLKVR